MAGRLARVINWTHAQAQHPRRWTITLLVPLADYVFPFFPANTTLMCLAGARPRHWRLFAVAYALSNAIGAALMAWLLGAYGTEMLERLVGDLDGRPAWTRARGWVQDNGVLVLIPLSMLVFPPRLAVAACGMAGLSPLVVGLSVFAGRLVPMLGFARLGVGAPAWARRIGPVRRLLDAAEAARADAARASENREDTDGAAKSN